MQGYANWGGLVRELGFQIVTQLKTLKTRKAITQIGAKRRTFHRPFTARFLFRKLLHFA